jgi:hypothetical protein
MTDSEPLRQTSNPPPHPELETLLKAHESLRRAFHILLVLLLILTGSLSVFFMREISIARRQISDLTQAVVDYEKNALPLMEEFRSKLQAFVQAHPDFMPIYAKYFGTNLSQDLPSAGAAQPLTESPLPRLPPGPQ